MSWRPEIDITFVVLAALTVGSGLAAIALRNLIHCALCFATCLLGVAGLFLWLGAQFIGFAQILVYVGAISILVVFAILLTRGGGNENGQRFFGSPLVSAAIAILVGGMLLACVASSNYASAAIEHSKKSEKQILAELNDKYYVVEKSTHSAPVLAIGQKLMTSHVLALEIIALMLTAALLGAVTLAMPERKRP